MSLVSELMNVRRTKGEARSRTALEKREARIGLLFISPWLIGFILFYFLPMIASLVFSFMDFQLAAPDATRFVGLENWQRALTQDPNTWQSMAITLRFTLISLPISMLTAFLLAVLLNSKHLLAPAVFRTLFYAPTMIPTIAATLIWSKVLNPQSGWINRSIEAVTGLQVTGNNGWVWLTDPNLIYFAFTFIGLWGIGNAILINLAGLQNIPSELMEAAEIDGAGWWQRLWRIAVPLVSPVIFYNLILNVVGLLKYFLVPWVLNEAVGRSQEESKFFMIYFYKQAFTFANMGYGATLAWILFIVALLITLVLFATARYWVYYAGERNS